MTGRAGVQRDARVVNSFIPSWLEKSLEGVRNEFWLEGNPKVDRSDTGSSNMRQVWWRFKRSCCKKVT